MNGALERVVLQSIILPPVDHINRAPPMRLGIRPGGVLSAPEKSDRRYWERLSLLHNLNHAQPTRSGIRPGGVLSAPEK